MDTETKRNGGQPSGCNAVASNNTAPDMMTLLGQSSLPASTCGWLSCLRKSGMSLTYSLQKQHIPNMDQPQPAQSGAPSNGQNGGQGQGNSQGKNTSSAQGNSKATGTSDTMTCSGSCSVRYFDLAVGAILVLTVCGILKSCRHIKGWF